LPTVRGRVPRMVAISGFVLPCATQLSTSASRRLKPSGSSVSGVGSIRSSTATDAVSDVTKFALFMRFLAPPEPAPETPSSARGRSVFSEIGCALCHTPSLTTGRSSSAALSEKPAGLFSDLLLHRMGPRLADDIVQGVAGPDEFRTAPLWGLGQRIFLLHDGRTTDLVEAIEAHASRRNAHFPPSEANAVTGRFRALGDAKKQDLLDFLRSL